jgi:DNA-binding NtrC family response regulator
LNDPPRVLIVDDDENILKTVSTVLRDAGYTTDTAENGREAIKKTKANFYNLALIDIRLPDMEGIELLTALADTTPKMIKIIITGYPSLQNAVEAVNKGADGYIIKPANMADLLTKVKQHLEKQEKSKRYDQEKIKDFIETRIKESNSRENDSR